MQVAGRGEENFCPRRKSGGRVANVWGEDDERGGCSGDAGAEKGDDAALVRSRLVVAVVGPVVMAVRGIARVEIGMELRADREDHEHHNQGGGTDREGAVEQAEQWRLVR